MPTLWTAPRTYVAGEVITASIGNTHWRDNLIYLKGTSEVPTIESGLIINNTLGTEYLRVPSLTTTQRTALTPVNGMVIYNSTTAQLETYENSIWEAVRTKKLFVPVTYGTNGISLDGTYAVAALTALGDKAAITFIAPSDFTAIVTATVLVIPQMSNAAANWDIYANYAATGQAQDTHAQFDTTTTYNVTDNQLYEVNISSILTSLAAGDRVGFYLNLGDATHDVNVVGAIFEYT